MVEALHCRGRRLCYVQPRRSLEFRGAVGGEEPAYLGEQVPACLAGEAAHFAGCYTFLAGWTLPPVTVTLPWCRGNACFAEATLQCLVRCGAHALWEAQPPGGAPPVTEAPPACEGVARLHLREALRQFAADGRPASLAAARHLVGRVMRIPGHRSPDLDDGCQHDCCEFLLRLLGALGWDAAYEQQAAGQLAWRLPLGAGLSVLQFQEHAGSPAPSGARAIVTHAGGPAGGHYTARGSARDGWERLVGSGARAGSAGLWPKGELLKLVFL